MTFDTDRLLELLPALYRVRDRDGGQPGPLQALLEVVAREVAVVEENLAQRYDDQFIETCAEWVVPYIGDLLGVRTLHPVASAGFSRRAHVANTIGYRRRKGTAAMLEQLARDVTGWDARVVEFFQLLATTQHLNHLRPGNVLAEIRHPIALEQVGGPFDQLAHLADVRRIATRRGRYNLPNVGIFLWRLQAFPLTGAPAVPVDGRRYRVSPLGADQPLVTRPETEPTVEHLAGPLNVPMPISRRMLAERLADYYRSDGSISLTVDGVEVPAEQVVACNLSDVHGAGGTVTGWGRPPAAKFAIDPVLGRVVVPAGYAGRAVASTVHRAFSMPLGGGEYARAASFDPAVPGARLLRVGRRPPRPNQELDDHATLPAALADLGRDHGVIQVTDSGRYREPLTVTAAPGQHLELRADDGQHPTLALDGALLVEGGAGATVTLNGFLVTGAPVRVRGALARLRLVHCTLVPGLALTGDGRPAVPEAPSLIVEVDPAHQTEVQLDHCVSGPLRLPADRSRLEVRHSIIDSPARGGASSQLHAHVAAGAPRLQGPWPQPATVAVTIGEEGPVPVIVEQLETAADADAVAERFQLALRQAATSPAFAQARVVAVDGRLVVLAGQPWAPVTVTAAAADPTAGRLGFRSGARRVVALVGGSVADQPALPAPRPGLQLAVGDHEPLPVQLRPRPASREAARAALARALRNARAGPGYSRALVGLLDDRLLLLPGEEGAAMVAGTVPEDSTTVAGLGLDGPRPAIAATAGGERPGPPATIEQATIVGLVTVRELPLASNSVFTAPLRSGRRQAGCVRFSFVPEGSRTPRRHACQPPAQGQTPVRLAFTSLRYGTPAYAQLGAGCAPEISGGADDEAEMGAFHDLFQPQRLANLETSLDEFLRFSMEAGTLLVN
jgi:hypothetical protein